MSAQQVRGEMDQAVPWPQLRSDAEAYRGSSDVLRRLDRAENGNSASPRDERVRVLLVEDNEHTRKVLQKTVELMGFKPTAVESGEAALAYLRHEQFDLLILDVQLPGISGLELLTELRSVSEVPTIFVSVEGEAPEGRVAGLAAGADDYLPKPFAPGELMFRINAVLRRRSSTHPMSSTLHGPGGLALSLRDGRVTVHGEPIELTDREFAVLATLLKHAGQVVRHEAIAGEAWGVGVIGSSNFIHASISRLRAKLVAAGAGHNIHTIRGVGYRL